MTGDQLQKAIDKLELSQVAAANFLGIGISTFKRWLTDETLTPEAVAMLLAIMIANKMTPDDATQVAVKAKYIATP